MIKPERVNIRNINSRGQYTFGQGYVYCLSDEDIKILREYYGDDSIACERLQNGKRRTNSVYKLQKNSLTKNGKIKKKKSFIGKRIVVGALVISLGYNVVSLLKGGHRIYAPTLEPKAQIETPVLSDNSEKNEKNADFNNVSYIYGNDIERENSEIRKYIKKYCAVYGVNYDIIYNKLSSLTNSFSSASFVKDGFIRGVSCLDNDIYAADNKELLICCAIRDMSQNPDKFGFDIDSLYTDGSEYQQILSYEALIDYYAQVFEIPEYRNLMYGIFMAETSGNSPRLVEDNNYCGLRDSNSDDSYDKRDNPDQGAIEFVAAVKYIYIEEGLKTLEDIQPIFAPDFENDGELWISNSYENMERAESVYAEIDEARAQSRTNKKF